MIEIKAPRPYLIFREIFLAGSIEMGSAENWQDRVKKDLSIYDNLILFNPRRDNWDSSWVQSKENEQFTQQVNWELHFLERSQLIALYFDPATKSPISLLELGLFKNKSVVCCPLEFWRRRNVEIVCERYDIPLYDNYEGWIDYLHNWMCTGG